jgi:hypothetical protein
MKDQWKNMKDEEMEEDEHGNGRRREKSSLMHRYCCF